MAEQRIELDRLRTGIPGLDDILGGGVFNGAAYIVQGTPGAGKTILANQICFNHAARGGKALYVSLLAEAHDRLLTYLSPMRFYDAAMVPANIFYMSAFSILQKEGPVALQRLLVEEIRKRGATLVVIDGLFVVHDAFASEPAFRRFVHEMQGMASLTRTCLLMLTNQNRDRSSPEHTMVDGWIELLDEMHHMRAVRVLVLHKQRGSASLRGRHYFRIADDGIMVFPRMEAIQPHEPARPDTASRISSGIPQFDTMLHGGYSGGSATMLLGPSGSGKTTFGLQFLAASTPEAPGLLFSFFETPASLMRKAHSVGLDLEGMVERRAVHILWQPVADHLVDELGHRLSDAVRGSGAKRVFVDGIGGFERAMLFPHRLPAFINAVNNMLKSMDATVLYSRETRDLFALDRLDTNEMSAMAENLVMLHYQRSGRMLRRLASILKSRDSDFDPMAEEFHISSQGIRFGPPPSPQDRPRTSIGTPPSPTGS